MVMMRFKQLVKACIQGDAQAQKDLYDFFAPKMMVVALRYSKSNLEAEDIMQEGFVQVFKKLSSLKDTERLGPWIKRIIVNKALNMNRSRLYMLPMYEVENVRLKAEDTQGLANLQFQEMLRMIQELPTGCQVVFNMYAIEGFSHQEIADKLGVSVGTTKSQLARARMLLKKELLKREEVNYGTI